LALVESGLRQKGSVFSEEDRSPSLHRLADVHISLFGFDKDDQHLRTAGDLLTMAVGIDRRVADASSTPQARRDLAVGLFKLGRVQMLARRESDADRSLRAALAEIDTALATGGDRTDWREEQAALLRDLARRADEQAQPEEAAVFRRRAALVAEATSGSVTAPTYAPPVNEILQR
jgi:hypothetical protein